MLYIIMRDSTDLLMISVKEIDDCYDSCEIHPVNGGWTLCCGLV